MLFSSCPFCLKLKSVYSLAPMMSLFTTTRSPATNVGDMDHVGMINWSATKMRITTCINIKIMNTAKTHIIIYDSEHKTRI